MRRNHGAGRRDGVHDRRHEGARPRPRPRGRRRTRCGPSQIVCSKTEDSEPSSAVRNRSGAKRPDAPAGTHCRRDGSRCDAHCNPRALEPPSREAVAAPPSPTPVGGSREAHRSPGADRLASRSAPGHGDRVGLTRAGRAAAASGGRALPCGAGGGLAAAAARRPASTNDQMALSRLDLLIAGPPAGT
jgi:hypothetical protein